MRDMDWRHQLKALAFLTWWLSTWMVILVLSGYYLPPIINEFPDDSTSILVAFLISMVGFAWYAGGQMNELLDEDDD